MQVRMLGLYYTVFPPKMEYANAKMSIAIFWFVTFHGQGNLRYRNKGVLKAPYYTFYRDRGSKSPIRFYRCPLHSIMSLAFPCKMHAGILIAAEKPWLFFPLTLTVVPSAFITGASGSALNRWSCSFLLFPENSWHRPLN